jgi:hypothetical protein
MNPGKTTILSIRRRRKTRILAESAPPNSGTVCGGSPIRPYSELRLVLPSKTPARGGNVFAKPMLRPLRADLSKDR